MLSHIEMAPAAGFKLFGTVIIQPMHGGADAIAPGSVKPEQEHEAVQGGIGARGNDGPQRRISPPLPQQEAAEARAAAEKSPLPCPRCRSRDTKFCYFNNYNVNQPRHFCRACHRYWTAGGALRNVPVGAGRRKNRPVGPAPSAVVGHRAATGASGFVLGFPNQSCPAAPLPVYTGPAELDRWRFFRTERPVESDRGY